MWDTRSIELTVDLPADVADDVEEVTKVDPDFFGRAIQYAIARRVVFEELNGSLIGGSGTGAESGFGARND